MNLLTLNAYQQENDQKRQSLSELDDKVLPKIHIHGMPKLDNKVHKVSYYKSYFAGKTDRIKSSRSKGA